MTAVQVTHMLQAARFKTFEKVRGGQRSHSHPARRLTRYVSGDGTAGNRTVGGDAFAS
jgi:hypothetical protein